MISNKFHLKDLAVISAGNSAPKKEDFSTYGIPFIRAGHLEDLLLGLDINTLPKLTEQVAEKYKLKLMPKGTIVFAKSGMSATKNRVYQCPTEVYVVSHLATLIPDTKKINGKYLTYFLRWFKPSSLIIDESYPSIRTSDIGKIQISLPTMKYQIRIAYALAEAESLIQKRKEAITKLDRLAESIFYEMFGDRINNPDKEDVQDLGSIIVSGPQNGLYKPASDYGQGSPILRIDSFYNGKISDVDSLKLVNVTQDELEKYSLNKGDIVINRVNSKKYLGKSAIVQELIGPTVFESNMMRFSVNTEVVDPEYLIYFLQQPFVKHQILSKSRDAVNQSSINQQDVKSLMVYLPELIQQRKFALISRKIDEQKYIMSQQITKLEENFQSLLHQAFTGQLKFREEKVNDYAVKR